jgi:hypothetical protein
MAATSQQGTYLGTTLTGFTAAIAGLVITSTHTALGGIIALSGIALLGISTFGFLRLKQLEAKK